MLVFLIFVFLILAFSYPFFRGTLKGIISSVEELYDDFTVNVIRLMAFMADCAYVFFSCFILVNIVRLIR